MKGSFKFNLRDLWGPGLFALLALFPLLAGNSPHIMQTGGFTVLLASLALSWNVLGITGLISLGHAAFFGLGAYGAALLAVDHGVSPMPAILFGGLVAMVYGALWGLFFRKLRGAYYALATLASVEIPRGLAGNLDSITHGSLGVLGVPPVFRGVPLLTPAVYYLLTGVLALVALGLYLVFKTRWGLAIRSVREEEVASGSLGVNVFGIRFMATLASAFLTGVTGALYAHLVGLVEPDVVFGLHFSALPMIFAICGGRYTLLGPAAAAILIYPLEQLVFHPLLPAGHQILYGLLIMAAILFMPQGFVSWMKERWTRSSRQRA